LAISSTYYKISARLSTDKYSTEVLQALAPPERDRRLEQIDPRLSQTFDWAFEDDSLGITQWLQDGQGLFWIRGKPGSGKSTFMKFLYNDDRTKELLYQWKSNSSLFTPSFFFHHRGTNLQKSFEGLLRSIISQVLEKDHRLFSLLSPILDDLYRSRLISSGLGYLRQDIADLIRAFRILPDRDPSCSFKEFLEHHGTWGKTEGSSRNMGAELRDILANNGIDPGPIPIPVIPPKRLRLPNQDHTTENDLIKYVIHRHDQRYQLMIATQTEPWTLERLEKALLRLVSQKQYQMRLCLFLDALDEYYGQPEFIANFLQDLIRVPSGSLTSIRIIFCSRPWNAFIKHFARYPGIEIHQQTEQDIYNYCVASIPDDRAAQVLLSPLVPKVARRARGVFLWVRLVMHELGKVVQSQVSMSGDRATTTGKLHQVLDLLPSELDDFYSTIIERIPQSARWNSYVLFETVCRSETYLSPETLYLILILSQKDPTTVHENVEQAFEEHRQQCAKGDLNGKIIALTGGLIEIDRTWNGPQVQFMHQTVQEFVEDPEFKVLLLKNGRARITHENGHSFLARHLLLTQPHVRNNDLGKHARLAEQTTGCSQFELFSPAKVIGGFRSLIAFAVYAGLYLLIRDAHSADAEYVNRQSGDAIEALIRACESSYGPEDAIEMAVYLLEKGFKAENHLDAFQYILLHNKSRWHNAGQTEYTGTPRIWQEFDARFSIEACDQLVHTFVEVLPVSGTLCPKMRETNELSSVNNSYVRFHNLAIHEGGLGLIRGLLKKGIDPNLLDGLNRTPMDTLLNNQLTIPEASQTDAVKYTFDICCLLAESGGCLQRTSEASWKQWEQTFSSYGHSIEILRKQGLPRWCPVPPFGKTNSSNDKSKLSWFRNTLLRRNK
jgi:hypothetical protein